MKVDKIKKAISELTPSEELSERIMDMAASYEKSAVITEQPIRTVRPGRMLKLAAIAAALVILISKRTAIREWRSSEVIHRTYLSCFFSSLGMIVFLIVMGLMMVYSFTLLITPI